MVTVTAMVACTDRVYDIASMAGTVGNELLAPFTFTAI